jgi:hypothetical protein
MIVSEKNVSDALTFFALGGEADEEAAFLAAEQQRERVYAELFLDASGTQEARKAWVTSRPEYQAALDDEREAKVALTRAKRRGVGAEKLIDVFRTENASARKADNFR